MDESKMNLELSEYDKKYLNAQQQEAVIAAKKYGYMTGDWKTANTMAEGQRAQAGYSGGVDGSQYIQTNASYIDGNGDKKPGYTTDDIDYDAMMQEARDAKDRLIASNNNLYSLQLQKQQNNANGQIDQLNADFDSTGRQLYRDMKFNQKNIPQSLAAQGITGGLAESSLIRLANGYEGNLNDNERQRALRIADVRRGVSDAELQLAIQREQANAAAEDNLYTRINAIMLAAKQQKEREEERDYTRAWNEEDRDYNRAWNEEDRDYNRNWAEDDRNYNRTWSEDDRDYNRGNDDYNKALNEATLAMKLGDNSLMYNLLGITPTQKYSPAPQPVDIYDNINQLVAAGVIDEKTAIQIGNMLAGTQPRTPETKVAPSGSGLYTQYLMGQATK